MKHTKESIQELLKASDKAVYKGLLTIYSFQTHAEQDAEMTKEHNGVGFSGYDANFMTSLAKSLIRFKKLTPKQMKYARKKMMRYAGQLARVANGELEKPKLPIDFVYLAKPDEDKPTPRYEDEERKAIQEETIEVTKPKPPLVW